MGSAAQQTPTTYPVNGVVRNSLTHQPVARVLIEAGSEAVLSDSEGRFALQLHGGIAQIILRRPGYGNGPSFTPEIPHTVRIGPNLPDLTFYITPSASVVGHVVLSTGDEADDVRFTLYRKSINEGHARWTQAGDSTVGSDGVFRFSSLDAPGSYVFCSITAQDRIAGPVLRAAVSGYPDTCYPGAADFASAIRAPLALSPGQQAQLEISLARQAFYPISISAMNSNPSIQIFDASGRPMNFGLRRVRQSGTFVADLPNGSYYAELRQGGKPDLFAHLDFTVAGVPLSGLTMIPLPAETIPVEIHREFTADSGTHAGGFITRSLQNDLNLNLNLTPVDRPFMGQINESPRHPQGSPDSDLYEIDMPSFGTYRIEAFVFQTYVSSMTSAGIDLLRDPLVIRPGNTAPIEIVVRNDLGRLEYSTKTPPSAIGEENSGEVDIAPIFVYAIPQSSPPQRVYQSEAQVQSGTRVPFPLPPGPYLILAFKEAHDIDLDDADEISRLAKEGQIVTIGPSTTTEVQLDPISEVPQEASQ